MTFKLKMKQNTKIHIGSTRFSPSQLSKLAIRQQSSRKLFLSNTKIIYLFLLYIMLIKGSCNFIEKSISQFFLFSLKCFKTQWSISLRWSFCCNFEHVRYGPLEHVRYGPLSMPYHTQLNIILVSFFLSSIKTLISKQSEKMCTARFYVYCNKIIIYMLKTGRFSWKILSAFSWELNFE